MRRLLIHPVFLIALSLVAGVMTGCLRSGGLSLDPYGAGPLQGFSAEVVLQDGTKATFALSGPVDIPDVTTKSIRAYELLYEVNGPNPFKFGWYLDSSLRVVVGRNFCVDGDCRNQTSWNWMAKGDVPPFGMAWPHMILSGNFSSKIGRHLQEGAAENRIHGNGTLELRTRLPRPPALEGPEPTYWYKKGQLLPNGSAVRVVSYHVGEPLGPADSAIVDSVPSPGDWRGLMFEGENQDTFDVGATHDQIVRAADSRLGSNEAVCVQSYRIFPKERQPPQTLPSLEDSVTATALVAVLNGNRSATYQINVVRRGLDGTTRLDASRQATSQAEFSCSDVRASPWPEANIDDGIAFARSLRLSGGRVNGFYHIIGSQRLYGREAFDGWHQWYVTFVPAYLGNGGGFSQPYRVVFEPTRPMPLQDVLAGPQDRFWQR